MTDDTRVRAWIDAVLGEPETSSSLANHLRSGVLLCRLLNAIVPNSIPKINTGPLPFGQRENIKNFTDACRTLGMRDHDLFVTVDLFEEKNMKQVVHCLLELSILSRSIPTFKGPYVDNDIPSAANRIRGQSLFTEIEPTPASTRAAAPNRPAPARPISTGTLTRALDSIPSSSPKETPRTMNGTTTTSASAPTATSTPASTPITSSTPPPQITSSHRNSSPTPDHSQVYAQLALLSADVAALEATVSAIQNEQSSSSSSLSSLELDTLKEHQRVLTLTIKQLQLTIDTLTKDVDRIKSSTSTPRPATSPTSSQELSDLKTDVYVMRESLATYQASFHMQQQQIRTHVDEMIRSHVTRVEERMDVDGKRMREQMEISEKRMKDTLDRAIHTVTIATSPTSSSTSISSSELSHLQHDVDTLRTSLTHDIDNIRSSHTSITHDINKLHTSHTSLSTDVTSLSSLLTSFMSRYDEQEKRHNMEMNEMRTMIQTLQSQITTSSTSTSTVSSSIIDELRTQITELKQQYTSDINNIKQQYTSDINNIKQTSSHDHESLHTTIQTQAKEISQLQSTIETLRTSTSTSTPISSDMTSRLDTLSRELEFLKRELIQTKVMITSTSTSTGSSELMSQLITLRSTQDVHANMIQEIQSHESIVHDVRNQLEALESELPLLHAAVTQVQTELRLLKKQANSGTMTHQHRESGTFKPTPTTPALTTTPSLSATAAAYQQQLDEMKKQYEEKLRKSREATAAAEAFLRDKRADEAGQASPPAVTKSVSFDAPPVQLAAKPGQSMAEAYAEAMERMKAEHAARLAEERQHLEAAKKKLAEAAQAQATAAATPSTASTTPVAVAPPSLLKQLSDALESALDDASDSFVSPTGQAVSGEAAARMKASHHILRKSMSTRRVLVDDEEEEDASDAD